MQILKKILIIPIFWNSFIFSEMKIEITQGVNSAYPIAIIPFIDLNQSLIPIKDIASIIASDLRNSGKFNTLPVAYLPHQPTKVSDIIPMFWEKLGINIIVMGTIKINHNNEYIVSYQLIDTSNNPALVILENQYSTQEKWLRYTAHTISNEIFEKLTGIKGVFCTQIAYIIRINNNQYPYELCIADYDGHNQKSICQSSEPLMSPAWSPDGTKIAYVTFSAGHSELIIHTLSTGSVQNIINFPQHNGAPAFSPDGKKLAFSLSKTGSLNLYIMDLMSGKIQQLTNNRNNNTEPSWFPNSKSLAYTSDQSGTPQIYKIDIDTTKVQRISWLYTNNQSPHVSADGTFIIMVNRYQGAQNIAQLNLLTKEEKILTNTILDDTPSIAPNDTMMIYSTITESPSSISILKLTSIDGYFKADLKNIAADIRFPTWSSCYSQ